MEKKSFELEKFDSHLETEFVGRNFIYLLEVDSTNSYLKNEAESIKTEGTVVLAEKQSEGRGRFDRTWYSAKALNLTFSILLSGKSLKKYLNLINLGTALAISNSIENLYQLKTELKWPNDILINGKKVCGILLESSFEGDKMKNLIVGIGLNVNQINFVGNFNIPPTSISLETDQLIEREKLLADILLNLEEIYMNIKDKSNYILKEWRLKCKMIGEKITVNQLDKTKYGIFDDIDEQGYLILKTEKRTEKISFGDVTLIQ